MSDSDNGTLANNKLQSTIVTSINQSSASIDASSTFSPSISVMSACPSTSATSTKPTGSEKRHAVISSILAGALAGATAKTVIAPLDRTKIYFQTHPEKNYQLRRALKYIHSTFKTEGFFYLWRGNSATMARIVPYASMQFLAHEHYKTLLGIHQDQLRDRPKKNKVRLGQLHFFAGSLAGMTGQALTYPLDKARAVMAVTRVGEYKTLADVFRRIVRNEGWLALYRGFVPTILGVIPYAGTSFFTYEQLKSYWTNRAKRLNPDDKRPGPTTAQRLASGALAGLLGQTASYPLDIVRRRMQTATQMGVCRNRYVTIASTLSEILRKEGFRKGWYKGVTMNFIKGPIAVGTSFATYDYFSVFIKNCLNSMKC